MDFHLIPDGMGGFFVEPDYGPGAEFTGMAFLGLGLTIIVFFVFFLFKMMGAALLFPLACLLVCGILFLAFGEVLNPYGLGLICLPIIMFAFACVSFSAFGIGKATDRTTGAFFGWLFFGVIMLVAFAVISNATGMSMWFGVPLFLVMFFVWLSAFIGYTTPKTAADLLKYCFRVLAIAGAAGVIVCFIHSDIPNIKMKDLLFNSIMFVLGCFPFFAFSGSYQKIAVGILVLIAFYVIIASLLVRKKLASSSSLRFLVIPYLIAFVFYLMARADLRYNAPIGPANNFIRSLLRSSLIQSVGDVFEQIAEMIGTIVSVVVRFIVNLVLMIFDSSIKPFHTPPVISGAVGFLLIFFSINLALLIRSKIGAKKK